mmetsp:Transcript_2885/g.7105  ORF Transcript_2885/g.7105 Transcript_2885/m.7105 type:complete len:444 (-) Transcript_2885:1256-2587(-)
MSGASASNDKSRHVGGAATARLAGEWAESMRKQNDGVWSRPVLEEDLLKWESLVLGPALSPYAFGFFSFRIQFPDEYPSNAPSVIFQTTAGGKTRFNPNLYADGKVCLSILGTWRGDSREQWSSVQNIQSVMVSIQSLMDDQPYHNEPGFEKETLLEHGSKRGGKSQAALEEITGKYNQKIQHETMRIAVCDVLEDILKADPDKLCCFPDVIKWHFVVYYDQYIDIVQEHKHISGAFTATDFEYPRNSMVGSFDYGSIETRLIKIKEQIDEETKSWERHGEAATKKGTTSYDCQQVNMALQRFERAELEGISASPQASNVFVWDVTIMGGLDGTWWENGIYSLKLIFPPEFPDVPPRPKFETKMFHPQITAEGYPFVSVSLADWKSVTAILADIHNVLRNPPNPDPRTWVNKEVAELYFKKGDKGREEYARRVRRCAQRSMED